MEVRIDSSWKAVLGPEFDKEYFRQLTDFVRAEYRRRIVYPPAGQIFAAFDSCPFDKVKVTERARPTGSASLSIRAQLSPALS